MQPIQQGSFNQLAHILSGQTKIIIPDLQRDYCWGKRQGSNGKSLALNFTESLIKAALQNENPELKGSQFSLGLLYSYQYPDNYFYLCDGQQRLTTLYLMLGAIKCLATEINEELGFKLEDILYTSGKEPRLRYEVRNTTVYFLKELLESVFLKQNNQALETLTTQNWWRKEYENDPSILDMKEALEQINTLFKKERNNLDSLLKFLLSEVGFVFFNLEIKHPESEKQNIPKSNAKIREYGEKMYEIVNTRGVPMESNEHLKPILLSQIELAQSSNLTFEEKQAMLETEQSKWTEKWEHWQDYFWINKRANESSADEGFNEFLTWVAKLIKKSDTVETLKDLQPKKKKNSSNDLLNTIEMYFNALENLISLSEKNSNIQLLFSQILLERKDLLSISLIRLRDFSTDSKQQQQIILLPLLHFIAKISSEAGNVYQFLRRLRKNYFDRTWEKRSHNYVDWRYILQIVDYASLNNISVLTFDKDDEIKGIANVTYNSWFTAEEKIKFALKGNDTNLISDIEEWEDHDHFMGDLTPLFKVYNSDHDFTLAENIIYDIPKLKLLYNAYLDFINIDGKTTEYKNHYYLLRLNSEFRSGWFTAGEGHCCITKINKENSKLIFINNWFYPIWQKLVNGSGIDVLKTVNKNIFILTLKNQFLNNDLLNNANLFVNSSINNTAELIQEFERTRLKEWWNKDYILSLIFAFMYIEALAAKDINSITSTKTQIGLCLNDNNLPKPELKYSFGNIKIGFHWPYDSYTTTDNLIIMEILRAVRNEPISKEDKIVKINSFINNQFNGIDRVDNYINENQETSKTILI